MSGATRGGAGSAAEMTAEVPLEAPAPPTDLHDPRQRAAVEHALTDVPGLIGARVVAGFDRKVDEVHVITGIDRSAKQTVRDVQTVLMARFGIPTDHRVVSVVQVEEGHGLPVASRVAIEEVGLVQSGLRAIAEVVLVDGPNRHRARCVGTATDRGRQRAVAEATLQAVAEFLDDPTLVVDLEGVDLVRIGGSQVAVTLVQRRTTRSEDALSGTAVVRDAVPDAIARSVLDAVNRLLQLPKG